MADKKNPKKNAPVAHAIKRCPYCQTYLKPHVTRCDSCNRRVGPPDRHGTAKKPIDWRAYLSAILAVGVLCFAIYWFFLK
jgi:hypothetical protein